LNDIFDTYLFVDWSASSRPTRVKPKRDAIWIGEWESGTSRPKTYYRRTRQDAAALVQERLEHHLNRDGRTLVGFDFPYGYPRGTGRAMGIVGPTTWLELWKTLAESIEDAPRNANNRWQVAASLNQRVAPGSAGPFWGCPIKFRSNSSASGRLAKIQPGGYSASWSVLAG
jgi:molybdopterin molybdotransferase